jgi:hypothetical protein
MNEDSTSLRVSKKTRIRLNLTLAILQERRVSRVETVDDLVNFLLDQSDYYDRVFSPSNPVCPKCGVKPVDYPGQICTDCWAEEREVEKSEAERMLEEKDSLEEGESLTSQGVSQE